MIFQKLWRDITQSNTTLCTTADQVAYGLEAQIRKFHEENSHHLAKSLVLQILDEFRDDVDIDMASVFQLHRHSVVTMFQFLMFLKPYETSFQMLVNDIAEEGEKIENL